AVELTRESCAELDDNVICYGNPSLNVQPHPNVRIVFAEPGDRVTLSAVDMLDSSPFDPMTGNWGLAVMQVRANLPDAALTVLSFGDVSLQNTSTASSDFIALDVTVREPTGAIVRETPAPDGEEIGTLFASNTYIAVGRLEDGSWIRLLDGGWVAAELLRSRFDLTMLEVLAPNDEAGDGGYPYGPMQSIHLRSGIEDSPCYGAPDSGLLVQTPDGIFGVQLQVNGAPLVFTGTLWLQTQATGETVVSVLEGEVLYGDGKTLEAGDQMQYGFQGDTVVYGPVTEYYYAHARYLPLPLLPREFELKFSLGGVIKPFTPGTGFLTGIAADAPCTVAWTGDVNLRSGPGTEYAIRRGLPGGFYAIADGRAAATDGSLWWRLADGIWIAQDNTFYAGACGDDVIPLVDAPPLASG
ncbi:MAG: SH3 domain-containing protein, partial [Anaerolineae bacterium]|nr:SH3 domain-containing protein [Anaerolineae bacterium]